MGLFMTNNDIIKELIVDKEYVNFLCEQRLNAYCIVELICSAPIHITRKIELLEVLCKSNKKAHIYKEKAEKAIKELTLKEGEIFVLVGYKRTIGKKDNSGVMFECAPFVSVDKVYEYFKAEEIDTNSLCMLGPSESLDFWYVLEKYALNETTGDMQEKIFYTFFNGQICYFYNYRRENKKCNIYENDQPFSTYTSQNLNLPVPYKEGDVLWVRVTPFTPTTFAVVADCGNVNICDCCFPTCLWLTSKDTFDYGALKHARIFGEFIDPAISPLYLAGRMDEKEIMNKTLAEVSKHLKKSPQNGAKLSKFLHENPTNKVEDLLKYINRE